MAGIREELPAVNTVRDKQPGFRIERISPQNV